MNGSAVDVTASLIANAMGALLLICVAAGNVFVIREQAKRNKHLVLLAAITVFSCILDSISALADGHHRAAVFVSNTLLFVSGPVLAATWLLLMADYIKVRISKTRRLVVGIFLTAALILITVNLFTPVLFTVNEYGVYQRVDGLYIIYATSYFGLVLDVVAMYIWKKHESGGLKFFPMWAFIIPIAIGMGIQNFFFGVSTIAPFMAISVTSMAISFQNNLLYKDQLTDLYNRYYLSVLDKKMSKSAGREFSIVMLDINDFKSINDVYGHGAGDEALVQLSSILTSIVDKSGEVIRYAGDEFIIILNSHDDTAVEALISCIHQSLKDFSETAEVPYTLSVAAGWCKFHFGEKTLNAFITEADRRMYKNKKDYYRMNPQHDRRNR